MVGKTIPVGQYLVINDYLYFLILRYTFEPFGAQRAVLTAVEKGLGPDDLLEVGVRGYICPSISSLEGSCVDACPAFLPVDLKIMIFETDCHIWLGQLLDDGAARLPAPSAQGPRPDVHRI